MKVIRVYTGYAGDYGEWIKDVTIGYATEEKVDEMIAKFKEKHQVNQFWMTYATIPARDGGREIAICKEEIEVII